MSAVNCQYLKLLSNHSQSVRAICHTSCLCDRRNSTGVPSRLPSPRVYTTALLTLPSCRQTQLRTGTALQIMARRSKQRQTFNQGGRDGEMIGGLEQTQRAHSLRQSHDQPLPDSNHFDNDRITTGFSSCPVFLGLSWTW